MVVVVMVVYLLDRMGAVIKLLNLHALRFLHVTIQFCHEAFFSSDELFKHMRNKHEECFVCKQKGDRDV